MHPDAPVAVFKRLVLFLPILCHPFREGNQFRMLYAFRRILGLRGAVRPALEGVGDRQRQKVEGARPPKFSESSISEI
jgi:hypothetical protein